MNFSDSALDRAIAASVATVPAPVFPAVAVATRIAQRVPRRRRSLTGAAAAAAAILVCSAGLAFAAPKVWHTFFIPAGTGHYTVSSPDAERLGDRGFQALRAERSFHATLPVGWPSNMRPVDTWRMGPASARTYIVRYAGESAGGGAAPVAVVFLQKSGHYRKARLTTFRHGEYLTSNGNVAIAKDRLGHMSASWSVGDEQVSIVSDTLRPDEIHRIVSATTSLGHEAR